MRYLLLPLALLVTSCTVSDVPSQDISEICTTCPSIGLPPTQLNTPNAAEPEPEWIDERTACPSSIVHGPLLERTLEALNEPGSINHFADLDSSQPISGHYVIEVSFVYEGTSYKIMWWDDPGLARRDTISVWERPGNRPFMLDAEESDIAGSDTYTDQGAEGCVNYGWASRNRDPDTIMYWDDPRTEDQNIADHDDWQAKYDRAIRAMATQLGVL